jgi:WD40 repeat protein
MANKTFNVFISYSRKDGADFVNKLKAKLAGDEKGKELKLWKDREQMEGDVGWWKQITDAIDQCEYLILVITPESLKSGVCQKEWRYARQVGVCVRPVKGVQESEMRYDLLPRSMRDAQIYDIDEEWAKFVNDLCRSCQVNKVPFMAPDLPKDYVPRTDLLNAVKQQLLNTGHTNVALTSALRGAGGFGKTTLATAMCYEEDIQDHFSAGILWITVGEEGNVLKEITKLYNALTNEYRHFIDIDEGARMLSERLEQGNYLLVIDDVWKYHHLEPFLRKALGTVRLITTRVDEVVREAKASLREVNEMKIEEAFQMLTKGWVLDEEDKKLTKQLIQELGEWPLLLKLMRSAALARIERGQTIKSALRFLKENYSRKGLVAFDARDPQSRNDAVAYCVEASLKMLSPEQRQYCIQLGIFPTDSPISADVIYNLWAVDAFDGEEILIALDEYSLLDFDMSKGEITFHDVMLHYYHKTLGNDLINTHRQLIKYWGDPYTLPNIYAWQMYVWHLVQAQEYGTMENLLTDYKWLKTKLEQTGIHAILQDYDLLPQMSKIAELLYKAFRMSAHVLLLDKTNLALQLHERIHNHLKEFPPVFCKALERDIEAVGFIPVSTPMLIVGNLLVYTVNQESEVNCCIAWQDKIIVGLYNGIIKIIYIENGKQLHECKGHTSSITCLAIAGDILISGSRDTTLRSWRLSTGKTLQEFKGHTDIITCLAIAGDILVSGSEDNDLRSWELSTGESLEQFKGHTGSITCLALAGDILISGSQDTTLRSWELSTGEPLEQFIGHVRSITCLAVAGDILVSGSEDNDLRSWELSTGESLEQFKGHTGSITCLALAGDIVVSGGRDNTLRSWRLSTGMPLQRFIGHTSSITCLAIVGDIVVSGSRDKALRSWGLSTGMPLQEFKGHTSSITCLAIAGDVVVSGGRDNTLRSWALSTGMPLQEFKGHTDIITCLAISGDILVSGSWDKTLRSWELSTGKPLQKFKGHTNNVTCLDVVRDILVTGSMDSTFRMWQLKEGKCISCLFLDEPIETITIDTAKNIIVAGGSNGGVYFFKYKEGFIQM